MIDSSMLDSEISCRSANGHRRHCDGYEKYHSQSAPASGRNADGPSGQISLRGLGGSAIKWVIVYDISDDALRTRVADRLGSIGWRVQESVFECTFDPEALPEVIAVLQRMLGESEGANIRIYRICHCRDCEQVAVGIGSIRPMPDEGACVIA